MDNEGCSPAAKEVATDEPVFGIYGMHRTPPVLPVHGNLYVLQVAQLIQLTFQVLK
ncbi:uncharacterized protein NFIA_094050 [Aspergillus fischeri NRRL 181]|uniref:Uncharacterized protein n=1 Tax=Neosartorya fischeri (strain ATCC 1020 / DSM 3700 / CBS 544.65 / FGSC A1164 / JCM 1740 / NRRL 181 / WB 181) TaxID=331117 RepID=A1DA95_NEOFI|nr:uncharacterized protein NFIA_094050 [Aspergillus fischeri NRRL 181]EAW19785.1 hypothetical protein NFIA_094050 [Aspergillus fischeri NRRL 181]